MSESNALQFVRPMISFSTCWNSRRHSTGDAMLREIKSELGFDLIELDGQDMRRSPFETRKASLERLVNRAAPGLAFNKHITGDGTIIFQQACKLGLEGIVSKRKDSRYISGRSLHWIKSKNPDAPAVKREPVQTAPATSRRRAGTRKNSIELPRRMALQSMALRVDQLIASLSRNGFLRRTGSSRGGYSKMGQNCRMGVSDDSIVTLIGLLLTSESRNALRNFATSISMRLLK